MGRCNRGNCEDATPTLCGVSIKVNGDFYEFLAYYNEGELGGPQVIVNYRPVYTSVDRNKCMWFDENGYWRQGNCENVGTSGNSKRISQQDLDCPITEIIE